MKWLTLAVGGVAGTFARYTLAGAVYRAAGVRFPYGTLVVNLAGCFLIGVFDVLAQEKFVLGAQARLFLMVGFCGAFTTFSTLILETDGLLRDGLALRAAANVAVSVAAGLAVFRAGALLGRWL